MPKNQLRPFKETYFQLECKGVKINGCRFLCLLISFHWCFDPDKAGNSCQCFARSSLGRNRQIKGISDAHAGMEPILP